MKTVVTFLVLVVATTLFFNSPKTSVITDDEINSPAETAKVQVAILLDASNSMDGLINQAKSRLWNIVNTLTSLKFNGKTPQIEIALYMYGNDGLPALENYIRQITPFTSNLDLISEKLFAITTNGGSEYCGAVIDDAVKNLDWGDGNSDMKLIYIAGNEEFTQGNVSYKESISAALKNSIYVNTIHCGDYHEGVSGYWKDAADRGQGKYFCINSDAQIAYIATPYDDAISEYNLKLNETYIYYGQQGQSNYANQSVQDNNAQSISKENSVNRAVSKSKSVYNNYDWDLVDRAKDDPEYLKKVDNKTLPEEYQNLNATELQKEIDKKAQERAEINSQITDLSKKRQKFIDEKMKDETTEDDFGKAIELSIIEFAQLKGFEIEK
ncbi:MAG: VWA domain-containing protein [Bacteroidales bacterium]|nr:VWA domain-containing protein [Bacteroidales bacterium]